MVFGFGFGFGLGLGLGIGFVYSLFLREGDALTGYNGIDPLFVYGRMSLLSENGWLALVVFRGGLVFGLGFILRFPIVF